MEEVRRKGKRLKMMWLLVLTSTSVLVSTLVLTSALILVSIFGFVYAFSMFGFFSFEIVSLSNDLSIFAAFFLYN